MEKPYLKITCNNGKVYWETKSNDLVLICKNGEIQLDEKLFDDRGIADYPSYNKVDNVTKEETNYHLKNCINRITEGGITLGFNKNGKLKQLGSIGSGLYLSFQNEDTENNFYSTDGSEVVDNILNASYQYVFQNQLAVSRCTDMTYARGMDEVSIEKDDAIRLLEFILCL